MKKRAFTIMLFCLLAGNGFLFCQKIYDPLIYDGPGFNQLPLEEQLELYFNSFRDGYTNLIYPRLSGYIVHNFGPEVIPYLKEYMNNADFFSLRNNLSQDKPDFFLGEPNDITLDLVAYIWRMLNLLKGADYIRRPYAFDEIENEIQWFVDEYKRRIDEYILAVRAIDGTVLASERMLFMIAGWGGELEVLERYGHPNFGIPAYYLRGRVLKEYYEQRLGINDLTIDYNVFQE